MHKYCVLTNDLQHELVDKNEERKGNVEKMAPRLVKFLNSMRDKGVAIVHLQLIYDHDDKKIELHDGKIPVLRGSPGAELLPEYLGEGDVIIEKKKDSGFFETTLDSFLKENSIDTVIITGMQAQACVQTTAADAHFRGYNVLVPEDGIVSTKDADRIRALEWLESYCAQISPLADIDRRIANNESFDFAVPALP